MITLFLLIGIGIIIGAIIGYKDYDDWTDGIIGGFCGGIIGCFIGSIVALNVPTPPAHFEKTVKLEVLQDGSSGANGSFFLGIGTINERMQYVYYYQDGGYYQMGQLDYNQAKIKYVDTQPLLRYKWVKYTNTKWGLGSGVKMQEEIIFEVPKGTIKQDFTLDAK